MALCSEREDKWISLEMILAYTNLHKLGYAHSVETWMGDKLVGGLYGLSIGGVFFGESMVSLVPQASKFAFYRLVEILKINEFILLDSQYLNSHTEMLGAIEIPDVEYKTLLDNALKSSALFNSRKTINYVNKLKS